MDWAHYVAPLVSVTGALVSVVGVAFTVWKGSKELERWRITQRETKRAEVAGDVLVAALTFLTELGGIVSPWYFAPPGQSAASTTRQEENQGAEEECKRRWQNFAVTQEAFLKAWRLAETYLDDGAREVLEELWTTKSSIYASQDAYFRAIRRGWPMTEQTYCQAFGEDRQRNLDEIREKARSVFRRLVLLDQDARPAEKA